MVALPYSLCRLQGGSVWLERGVVFSGRARGRCCPVWAWEICRECSAGQHPSSNHQLWNEHTFFLSNNHSLSISPPSLPPPRWCSTRVWLVLASTCTNSYVNEVPYRTDRGWVFTNGLGWILQGRQEHGTARCAQPVLHHHHHHHYRLPALQLPKLLTSSSSRRCCSLTKPPISGKSRPNLTKDTHEI